MPRRELYTLPSQPDHAPRRRVRAAGPVRRAPGPGAPLSAAPRGSRPCRARRRRRVPARGTRRRPGPPRGCAAARPRRSRSPARRRGSPARPSPPRAGRRGSARRAHRSAPTGRGRSPECAFAGRIEQDGVAAPVAAGRQGRAGAGAGGGVDRGDREGPAARAGPLGEGLVAPGAGARHEGVGELRAERRHPDGVAGAGRPRGRAPAPRSGAGARPAVAVLPRRWSVGPEQPPSAARGRRRGPRSCPRRGPGRPVDPQRHRRDGEGGRVAAPAISLRPRSLVTSRLQRTSAVSRSSANRRTSSARSAPSLLWGLRAPSRGRRRCRRRCRLAATPSRGPCHIPNVLTRLRVAAGPETSDPRKAPDPSGRARRGAPSGDGSALGAPRTTTPARSGGGELRVGKALGRSARPATTRRGPRPSPGEAHPPADASARRKTRPIPRPRR